MPKKNMADVSEKKRIRERLCHALDIPPDIFLGGTLVEMRDRNFITVKGGGGITLYTDTQIRILVRGGELCVCGERLCCTAYRRGTVSVDGLIRSVSFEEANKC